jgi:hypothetical protein
MAVGLPLLHDFNEASITGSEILCAHIKSACIAALARHSAATAVAFIEEMDGVPRAVKRLSS